MSHAPLDLTAFTHVLDAGEGWVDTEGLVTYERLADTTLARGAMPCVVPQLKSITIGGAVAGVGIEATSFRYGLVHDTVLELEVLTGRGDVVLATPDNEHRDLFHAFPNSYGTLGYALRIRTRTIAVRPYVHVVHRRYDGAQAFFDALAAACDSDADFVDGVVFGPEHLVLSVARFVDEAPYASDYTFERIYYRSLLERDEDYLSVRGYLWRWDTDWFWCSRAFLAQKPLVRRLAGRRLLRSDTYWKLMAFEGRHHWKARLDSFRGRPPREDVVQDVELPVEKLEEFLAGFQREVPISPFWLCPLRQRDRNATWELYRLDPDRLYVNVGFWSSVPLSPGMDPAHHNRWVEDEVDRLGGRKSLYSTAFYDEERFWQLYNGPAYSRLKSRYDPERRLHDLYAKCVDAR